MRNPPIKRPSVSKPSVQASTQAFFGAMICAVYLGAPKCWRWLENNLSPFLFAVIASGAFGLLSAQILGVTNYNFESRLTLLVLLGFSLAIGLATYVNALRKSQILTRSMEEQDRAQLGCEGVLLKMGISFPAICAGSEAFLGTCNLVWVMRRELSASLAPISSPTAAFTGTSPRRSSQRSTIDWTSASNRKKKTAIFVARDNILGSRWQETRASGHFDRWRPRETDDRGGIESPLAAAIEALPASFALLGRRAETHRQ